MAITRAQQARQMLKKGSKDPVVQGGVDNYLGKQPQVVAPRKWQSSPDAPPTELAYITKAEKDLILKKDIHGSLDKGPNMGPSGIMSLDSFGDIGGGGAMEGRGFSGRGPSETKSGFDARVRNQREILQKAEQRQAEDLGYRERRNISDFRAKRGPFGIGSLFSTVLGFINPFLGLASRAVTGIPGAFKTFKQSPTLADFYKNMTGNTGIEEDDEGTLLDQVSPDLPFAKTYLQGLQKNTVLPEAKPQILSPNQISDELIDFDDDVDPGFQIQAKDGGRIQYMDGGIADLLDIYD